MERKARVVRAWALTTNDDLPCLACRGHHSTLCLQIASSTPRLHATSSAYPICCIVRAHHSIILQRDTVSWQRVTEHAQELRDLTSTLPACTCWTTPSSRIVFATPLASRDRARLPRVFHAAAAGDHVGLLQQALLLLWWYVGPCPPRAHVFATARLTSCFLIGRSKVDYDNVLADSEREAVADLLNYLENVPPHRPSISAQ